VQNAPGVIPFCVGFWCWALGLVWGVGCVVVGAGFGVALTTGITTGGREDLTGTGWPSTLAIAASSEARHPQLVFDLYGDLPGDVWAVERRVRGQPFGGIPVAFALVARPVDGE